MRPVARLALYMCLNSIYYCPWRVLHGKLISRKSTLSCRQHIHRSCSPLALYYGTWCEPMTLPGCAKCSE